VQCFVKVLKSLAWASRVSWVVEDFNSTRKALFHSTNFGEGIAYRNHYHSLGITSLFRQQTADLLTKVAEA
jgi:hypothetical protein